MTNNRPNAGLMYSPYGGGSGLMGMPPVKLKDTKGLPNPYANTVPTQSNLPSGFVSTQEIAKPEYKVDPYKVQRDNQQAISDAGKAAMSGVKSLGTAMRAAKAGDKVVTGLKIGRDGAVKAASGIGKAGTIGTAATSLGIGLAGAGMGFAGQKLEDKALERDDAKGYIGSQALEYAGKGMSAGSTIGGMIMPGVGSILGGLIGGAAGAIGGTIGGAIKKDKILDQRTEEQKRIDAENERIRKQNISGQIKARDQYKTNLLYSSPKFQMGGTFNQPAYLDIANLKPEEQQLVITKVIELYKKGEDVGKIATTYNLDPNTVGELLKAYEEKNKKKAMMMPASFKKGGKLKAKTSCGCGGKIKFTKGGKMSKCKCGGKPMFKRGGELDLAKQNVILDGPSHDELNNTGVKGDKGLPVVKMGKGGAEKIAEIESLELMINADSSQYIQELRKKAKAGDKKAIAELGRFLHEELEKNTYDYSNLMS